MTEPAHNVTEALARLREEFPKGTVGKLPKPYRSDSQKGTCPECKGYHGLPAMHLDYVGHAAVTDRLLTVDPFWTWEPFGIDPQGLPALDRDGNLWIRLTVCGVTRVGVGDGKSMKERIGDAIRNAAMRFGVALDLWSKEELESGHAEAKPEDPQPLPVITHGTEVQASRLLKMDDPYTKAPSRGPLTPEEIERKRQEAMAK